MVVKGIRKIKNKFDPEKELEKLKVDIDLNNNVNIDMANRVFMYIIENHKNDDIISIFNELKKYKNETTFSLMIRYYSKTNLNKAIELLNLMDKLSIKIKKRTLMPIFNKLIDNNSLEESYQLFKKRMKKNYEFDDEDYHSILKLILQKGDKKKLNSFFKSMKRNIRTISSKLSVILKDDKYEVSSCKVNDTGICNDVTLESIDLKAKEKNIILSNIENIYANDKIEDLNKYKEYLDKNKNINVLLDGANILFNTDRKISINGYHRINTIYKFLKENNKIPLIILHQRHKDYLNKSGLNKTDIKHVESLYKSWEKNNDLYLTPYKMNDDWFFLYGSVYIDKCMVVTNDQLRDHIFKISEKEIHEDLLKKWIERRIINYSFKYQDYQNDKTLKLIYPTKFSMRIQKIDNIWYFPKNINEWISFKL